MKNIHHLGGLFDFANGVDLNNSRDHIAASRSKHQSKQGNSNFLLTNTEDGDEN